jgi:hypothetical protein
LTILIVPFSAPIILSIAFSNAVIAKTRSKKNISIISLAGYSVRRKLYRDKVVAAVINFNLPNTALASILK